MSVRLRPAASRGSASRDRAATLGGLSRRALAAQIGRWAEYLAALVVGSTLLAVWLISGVPAGDVLRFVGFEAAYVLLPGCLLYALLSRAPAGGLRTIAIAWPLGYALEIGAFALTAALGVRGMFALLPVLAAVTMGPAVFFKLRQPASGATRGSAPGRSMPQLRAHGAE